MFVQSRRQCSDVFRQVFIATAPACQTRHSPVVNDVGVIDQLRCHQQNRQDSNLREACT